MSAFLLRVVHPDIDPREITETLGLPPQMVRRVDGEIVWETRLAGSETGRGGIDAGLRDIVARFEHYAFFVDEIRSGGGRVEIVIASGEPISDDIRARFAALRIELR
jgi:hypothetical protein